MVGESGRISAIASSTSPVSFGAGFVINNGDVAGDPRGRFVMDNTWPDASLPFLRSGTSGVMLCNDRRCFVKASDRVNVFPQSRR